MIGKWAKGNGNVGKGEKAVGGKEREKGKGDNGRQLTNSKSACGLVWCHTSHASQTLLYST